MVELLFWLKQGVGSKGISRARMGRPEEGIPLSLIRTVTVGPGIAPDLLTLPPKVASARGLGAGCAITAGGELHPALRTSRPLATAWDFVPYFARMALGAHGAPYPKGAPCVGCATRTARGPTSVPR
ncbi:hypothetical protein D3C81_1407170 [compost metagenome]